MTIGLALIARDEADTLPHLLDSITGAFDQVALVDTGSTDATAAVFVNWAATNGQDYVLDTIDWTDDFAAARNHAHELLETDWHSWADCDDLILGADRLRAAAANAGSTAVTFGYIDMSGRNLLPRPRLYPAGAGEWIGRVHEMLVIDGHHEHNPHATWLHTRPHERDSSNQRNNEIVDAWIRDDPETLIDLLMRRELTLMKTIRELQDR